MWGLFFFRRKIIDERVEVGCLDWIFIPGRNRSSMPAWKGLSSGFFDLLDARMIVSLKSGMRRQVISVRDDSTTEYVVPVSGKCLSQAIINDDLSGSRKFLWKS